MSFWKNIFRFLVYSNIFIACCAIAMVGQTHQLILKKPADPYFLLFVFSATICSYSFHWLLTPIDPTPQSSRSLWLSRYRAVHGWLLVTGALGVIASLPFLWKHWHWLILSGVITFLYSAPKIPHPLFRMLRKVALAKTIFLSLVWTYVTTMLPLQMSSESWRMDFTLFAAGRFFFIYAICILFDYRDREHDRIMGIRSLITWMDEPGINRLFLFSLATFTLLSCMLTLYGYSWLAVACLLVPGVIVGGLYAPAKENFSDTLYYFVLDGLMALPAVLSFLLSKNI
jgi:4-hydroxybenzoate polyprenyltransferase